MPRTRPRLVTILRCALVVVLTLGVGAVAWAGWSSDAQGAAGARTSQVPAPDATTATAVAGGADVVWTAVRVGEVPASGYRVLRRHEESGTTVPATGACAGVVTATSCRDTAVEPGTWTFAVRAVLGPWTGPASPPSAPVEVSGEVEASIDVTPREASPGDDLGGLRRGLAGRHRGAGRARDGGGLHADLRRRRPGRGHLPDPRSPDREPPRPRRRRGARRDLRRGRRTTGAAAGEPGRHRRRPARAPAARLRRERSGCRSPWATAPWAPSAPTATVRRRRRARSPSPPT